MPPGDQYVPPTTLRCIETYIVIQFVDVDGCFVRSRRRASDEELKRLQLQRQHVATLGYSILLRDMLALEHLNSARDKNRHILVEFCMNRNDHRLNGSSSPVLTATSLSYGKAKNSTPHRIKTPDLIEIKFRTVDYIGEMTPHAKFCVNLHKGGFSANR